MAIANPANAAEMARTFAATVQGEPAARALWFRQWGPTSELWLVTEPVNLKTERRLRSLGSVLYERFPDALIDLHVINLALIGESDPSALIPKDADSLPLR